MLAGRIRMGGAGIEREIEYLLATDDDFNESSFFRYIGTDKHVEIPHVIKGRNVTSYNKMFEGTSLKSVKSTNKNVTNMNLMFYTSKSTSLDLSNFDTSSVTNMSGMFQYSYATWLDLSSFDTSSVTSMSSMFSDSKAIRLDLSSFDTSSVTYMRGMFYRAGAITLDLSSFDTSNVTDMIRMFQGSEATSLDLSNFDTSGVTDMTWMFQNSKATSIDVSNFDTSSVTSMANMFYNSKATSLDVSNFDTSSVTSMTNMFYNSKATSLDVSNFDTSSVTDMSGMFQGSQATSLDLRSFDTSSVTDVTNMFNSSQAIIGYAKTQADADKFNNSSNKPAGLTFYVLATDSDFSGETDGNFRYIGTNEYVAIPHIIKGVPVTSYDSMFRDTSVERVVSTNKNITNTSYMFYNSQSTSLDLSNFDTSGVTDMTNMFNNSQAIIGYAKTQADADKFNNSSNKPAGLTFYVLATDSDFSGFYDGYFKYIGTDKHVEIPHIIKGHNVTSYSSMFEGTSVRAVVSTNKNVTSMYSMFYNTKSTSLDLSNFDTSSVTYMRDMFYSSNATSLDLSSFDTSSVTDMTNMFRFSSATTGYARTQADADKFNNSSNKPAALTFIVKP